GSSRMRPACAASRARSASPSEPGRRDPSAQPGCKKRGLPWFSVADARNPRRRVALRPVRWSDAPLSNPGASDAPLLASPSLRLPRRLRSPAGRPDRSGPAHRRPARGPVADASAQAKADDTAELKRLLTGPIAHFDFDQARLTDQDREKL